MFCNIWSKEGIIHICCSLTHVNDIKFNHQAEEKKITEQHQIFRFYHGNEFHTFFFRYHKYMTNANLASLYTLGPFKKNNLIVLIWKHNKLFILNTENPLKDNSIHYHDIKASAIRSHTDKTATKILQHKGVWKKVFTQGCVCPGFSQAYEAVSRLTKDGP